MRWRDVKQNRVKKQEIKPQDDIKFVPVLWRFKAFIIDMFMIYIPILYITTYMVLGSKEAFLENQIAIFADTFLLGFILSIFIAKSGQSPGYKAYDMKVIDTKTAKKPSFFRAFWRYICFLIAGACVIGLFIAFFRKDKKNLHDLLSRTTAVNV